MTPRQDEKSELAVSRLISSSCSTQHRKQLKTRRRTFDQQPAIAGCSSFNADQLRRTEEHASAAATEARGRLAPEGAHRNWRTSRSTTGLSYAALKNSPEARSTVTLRGAAPRRQRPHQEHQLHLASEQTVSCTRWPDLLPKPSAAAGGASRLLTRCPTSLVWSEQRRRRLGNSHPRGGVAARAPAVGRR